jgi:hypothetical protein
MVDIFFFPFSQEFFFDLSQAGPDGEVGLRQVKRLFVFAHRKAILSFWPSAVKNMVKLFLKGEDN